MLFYQQYRLHLHITIQKPHEKQKKITYRTAG